MEKSTLKKGGIVLLGAMTLFGTGILSWADVTEQVISMMVKTANNQEFLNNIDDYIRRFK